MMNTPDNLSDRERAMRKELAQRTVNVSSSDISEREAAADSPELIEIGRQITRLIEEELLEDASDMLYKSLKKHPEELMLLNFQMILESLKKKFGDYTEAKQAGLKLIEMAAIKKNPYYTMVAVNNLGIIAHKEGHEDYSLAMYLAAHYIDDTALFTLCNLAGWYSRKNDLEKAMYWIKRIIRTKESWNKDEEIVSFLKKDESLHNLRTFDIFINEILSKIE